MKGRKRRVVKKKRQRGGALFKKKPTLEDKIAAGAAMFLSGPAPKFSSLGLLLGKQLKFQDGIKDNVQHYRRRKK